MRSTFAVASGRASEILVRASVILITPFLLLGCGPKTDTASTPATQTPYAQGSEEPQPETSEEAEPLPGASDEESASRPEMTAEACEEAGGTVVGDIGDGAVHRPEYRCENGESPIGRVPSGIEGAVCCPG